MTKELPTGWITARLNEIAEINPRHPKGLDDSMQVSFVPMAAISESSSEFKMSEVRLLGKVRKGFTHFGEGDVLFAKITPCMENGKGAVARGLRNQLGCGTTELHVIRPILGISSDYIYRFLAQNCVRQAAKDNFTGTAGQARVPTEFIQELEISLAPIFEQQRIVAKLEKLLSRVESSQKRMAKIPVLLKRFRKSLLAAAFSGRLTADWREENPGLEQASKLLCRIADILSGQNAKPKKIDDGDINLLSLTKDEIPESWCVTRLGCCFAEFKNGTTATQNSEGRGHPVTRIETVQNFRFDLNRVRHIEHISVDELATFRYQYGDIAFSHINSYEHVGKTALYTGVPLTLVHGMNLLRLRLGHELLHPRFVHLFMQSDFFRSEVRSRVGHAVNQVSINQKSLAQVPIVIVPLLEQQEIVRRVEILFALIDKIEVRYKTAQSQVDKLTQSILAKAFRGELVPQDPNDEPVEQLLKRIVKAKTGKK